MRTDSTRISETAKGEASKYITEAYGKEYLGSKRKTKKSESTQDAHEAVRPTSAFREPSKVKAKLRSEEHTSELQSRGHLVCRLLLEQKKYINERRTVYKKD